MNRERLFCRTLSLLALCAAASTLDARVHFIHTDHLGSPIAMTDHNQRIVWRAEYLPFGKTIVDPRSTASINLRLPGHYFDQQTGLHFNHFREYDPALGRYLQPDPIGLKGGINPYVYANNNPLRFIDRNGLLSRSEARRIRDGRFGKRVPGAGGLFGSSCGTGSFAGLIPDTFFTFDFAAACDDHDACYGDCKKLPSKFDCDFGFLVSLFKTCDSAMDSILYAGCRRVGRGYFSAVESSDAATDAFKRARASCFGRDC